MPHCLFYQGSLTGWARVFPFAPSLAVGGRAEFQPIQLLDVRDPAGLDGATMTSLHIGLNLFVGSHQYSLSHPPGFAWQNLVVG